MGSNVEPKHTTTRSLIDETRTNGKKANADDMPRQRSGGGNTRKNTMQEE
jgi:hypothetical protein